MLGILLRSSWQAKSNNLGNFRLSNFLIRTGSCTTFATILLTTQPAIAQETGSSAPEAEQAGDTQAEDATGQPSPLSNAQRIYLPEEFAPFAPRNALDLIEEIPGFSVQGGDFDGGGRGLGEATGNLLINGDRLSSKSTSTSDQLSRIPVDDVIRIEIVDGATLEIPGLSGRVANIIVASSGMSGQFSWEPRFSTGPSPFGWSEGNISLRGSTRGVDYTLALDSGGFFRGSEGPAIFTDINGVDERFNTNSACLQRPELSGSFSFEPAPQVAVNLNLSAGLLVFRSTEQETRITGNPFPSFDERFRGQNNEHFYELSGDIEFPLGSGRLKLIALESFEHGNFRTQSLLDLGDLQTSGSKFQRVSDQGERIARAEYSWPMLDGDWQLSGEAAFNRLDNVASLFTYDANSDAFLEIPFPSGVGGVREDRYESILSYSRPLADGLSMQISLGGEYSQISQTGANALSRTFQRPKGSFSLAWNATPSLDVNLEVARRVGQLNFGDFLASVDLSDENENSGNNQLRPEQSWQTELEVAKDFGAWGSATLTLFDHRIEDYLTIVPLADGGESRGNIDSAHRYGASFNGTLQLSQLGWQGAQLDVRVAIEDSSLTDPVTLQDRRFDFFDPFEIRLDLRHDVPDTDWAWGLEFRDTEYAPGYRVSQVTLDHSPATFGALFIEHKDVYGLTMRVRFGNLFGASTVLQRTVYDGPRDSSPILFTEDRKRAIGTIFNIYISGSF